MENNDFLHLSSRNFLQSDQIWFIPIEKIFSLSRAFEWYKICSDWIKTKKVIVDQNTKKYLKNYKNTSNFVKWLAKNPNNESGKKE